MNGIRYVALGDSYTIGTGVVAREGLHPSGRQYARWVDLIAPVVLEALGAVSD